MAPFEIGRLAGASLLAIALLVAESSVGSAAADASPADGAVVPTVDVLAVTASSTDGMLMDAVDGDPSTAWQARAGVRDAWLAVRLEHAAALRGVLLQTGPMTKGETLAVETSQDGTHYQTQLSGEHIASDALVGLMFPSKAGALYVRVRFQYSGDGMPPRFRIEELQALSAT